MIPTLISMLLPIGYARRIIKTYNRSTSTGLYRTQPYLEDPGRSFQTSDLELLALAVTP